MAMPYKSITPDIPTMLRDELNLQLLSKLCAGDGLSINLSYLAKRLKRHRNTIRERVRDLTDHGIIDRPISPFLALYKERPLLVAVYADLPDNEQVKRWLTDDANVFAAFRIREGEYNMMLFELHESLWSYHTWREAIVKEGKIPGRGERIPSTAVYLSNVLIEKYEPGAPVQLIREYFSEKRIREINGCSLDQLSLDILARLTNGEGISVNENSLAKELGVHRRTVSERIRKLTDAEIILGPVCRFPSFFVPPDFMLVFSLIEMRKPSEQFVKDVHSDSHVSLAYKVSEGRYNLLLFEAHLSLEDYLKWESYYSSKYPGCFGSIKNSYLSPKMTISIDQQKVSLGVIAEKLAETREAIQQPSRRSSNTYLQRSARTRRQR
jgi:DNA-binding Lrp family transcriptional regulator